MRLPVDGESLKIYVFSRLFIYFLPLSPLPPFYGVSIWHFFFWLGYPGKRAFEGLSTKEQLLWYMMLYYFHLSIFILAEVSFNFYFPINIKTRRLLWHCIKHWIFQTVGSCLAYMYVLYKVNLTKCSTLTIYDDRIVFLNVSFYVKLLLNCFPNLKLYMI